MSPFSLTCYLTQRERDAVKFVKNFFGVQDINEARQRLDRLIQEEVAATAAQILEVVHEIKNGAQMYSPCNPLSFERPAL